MGHVTEAVAVAVLDAGVGVAARKLYEMGQVKGSITSLIARIAHSRRHTGYFSLTIQRIVLMCVSYF